MNVQKSNLRDFYLLWSSQSLSQLGNAITSFALTLWLYEKTGSALGTAALTVSSYAPYVVMSIFAGAISDKLDKKRTMLVCDALAALGTILVLALYLGNLLEVWHLYAIVAVLGLTNTVQQPASEVAYTLIVPKEHYQRTSGLQSLSRSLVSIGSPVIASALYGIGGLNAAIAVDLATFTIAFVTLAFCITIPRVTTEQAKEGSVLALAQEGLRFLRTNPLVLDVILFLAGVNFVASAFDATLPALVIPNPKGGNEMLGLVTGCSGLAMVVGSTLTTVMPKPKNRVRVIYLTMLISLGIENFMLALSREPIVWCVAQVIGWILVPVMSVNENVIMRATIPVELQGRVFACRNTLQFFTIPLGLLWGGYMVDVVCEPLMANSSTSDLLVRLFGTGKGSGAALMMFVLGVVGVAFCIIYGQRLRRYHFSEA